MPSEIKRVPPLALTSEDERHMRRLGAALVLHWASLPAGLQELLLDQAAEVDPLPEIKERDGLKEFAERGSW